MGKALNPSFTESWLEWFDKQPDDNAPKVSTACIVASSDATECANFDKSGCRNCENSAAVICPPECPPPEAEYYLGDLEEIAHAVLARTADAFKEYVRATGRAADSRIASQIFDGIAAEVGKPGYVEGLLPK
jgi:hypothetical protein